MFAEEIKALFSAQKLTMDDVHEFLESKVSDASEREALKLKFGSGESHESLFGEHSRYSKKGASWDANETLIRIGAGIFIIGFVYWAALDEQTR